MAERFGNAQLFRAVLVLFCTATALLGQNVLPDRPPVARLIQIGAPDAVGDVTVTGAAGAVATQDYVVVAVLETGYFATVQAGADGSFSAAVQGAAGNSILIKTDPYGNVTRDLRTATVGTVSQRSGAKPICGGA